MKQVVDVGLPPLNQPFSWAVKATGAMLFTAHGPVRPDGSIDTGPVEQQARITFTNLRNAVQAAGGTMGDVTQVLIYMTDVADMPAIDAVYREADARGCTRTYWMTQEFNYRARGLYDQVATKTPFVQYRR